MKALTLTIVTIISIIPFVNSVMKFILDEEITNCGDKPWPVDMTKFQLVMVNDTTTVANGTCVLKIPVDSPWKLFFYGEMYDRGHWTKKFERKFEDFCKHILKPGEIWYDPFYKKLNGRECPYKEGEVFPADEDAVSFDVSFMPVWFQGIYRIYTYMISPNPRIFNLSDI